MRSQTVISKANRLPLAIRTSAAIVIVCISTFTGNPTLAAQKHYTCTGLRGCANFASACIEAGGKQSVDTPSTPGGGPVVNHCRVNEPSSKAVKGLKAAQGQELKMQSR